MKRLILNLKRKIKGWILINLFGIKRPRPKFIKLDKAFHYEQLDERLRLRLFKGIARSRFPCEDCLRKGIINYEYLTIHHKDKDHSNNHFENLKLVCARCHAKYHDGIIPSTIRGLIMTIGDMIKNGRNKMP